MALTLRDFLRDLGDQLIRVDDEIDPVTQAAALCSAAPRPILLECLRGFPGWKLTDILVKDRARLADGVLHRGRHRDRPGCAVGVEHDHRGRFRGHDHLRLDVDVAAPHPLDVARDPRDPM